MHLLLPALLFSILLLLYIRYTYTKTSFSTSTFSTPTFSTPICYICGIALLVASFLPLALASATGVSVSLPRPTSNTIALNNSNNSTGNMLQWQANKLHKNLSVEVEVFPFPASSKLAEKTDITDALLLVIWVTPKNGLYTYANTPKNTPSTLPLEAKLYFEEATQEQLLALDSSVAPPAPSRLPFVAITHTAKTIIPTALWYSEGIPYKDATSGKTVMVYKEKTPLVMLVPATALENKTLFLQINTLMCSQTDCELIKLDLPLQSTVLSQKASSHTFAANLLNPYDSNNSLQTWLTNPFLTITDTAEQISANGETHPDSHSNDTIKHYNLTPVPFLNAFEVKNIYKACLFAFIAGLILNIMPCVLPVISLKISTLLQSSQLESPAQRETAFKEHSLFFALGILTWFSFLAVFLSYLELNWGQYFQNSTIVLGMIFFILFMALSLSMHVPLPVFSLEHSPKSAKMQAFSTGLFATLMATPCSGPLLGGVLAWSFQQNTLVLFIVFLCIGLGMATPYIIFFCKPSLVRFIPKPGNWLGYLEKVLIFFLFATAIYLFSLLPAQWHIPTLLTALCLSFCLWTYQTFGVRAASKSKQILVTIFSIALFIAFSGYIFTEKKQFEWQIYTPQLFEDNFGKQTLLVEFTADWCPNCKLLEKTVLTPTTLLPLVEKNNLVAIQVDLTHDNPAGWALLNELNSKSIPIVAVFPVGSAATSPLVLRDIFTAQQLTNAVESAIQQ